MVIRNAVQCGEIQQAIERTNAVDPAILAGDPELSFKLKQQQLVELIRSGGVEEALAFAQAELSPLAEGGRLRHRALARAAAHAAPPAASRSPASSLWAAPGDNMIYRCTHEKQKLKARRRSIARRDGENTQHSTFRTK